MSQDWDFRGIRSDYLTHGMHPYPARMHPYIARRLIQALTRPGELVLDPFCGSGTVMVEASLHGRNSIGIDLNPLAVLLSRSKTRPVNPRTLRGWTKLALKKLARCNRRVGKREPLGDLPLGINLAYWFDSKTVTQLARLKTDLVESLDSIAPEGVLDIFRVSFSRTVREVSYQRQNEYKLYRKPLDEIRKTEDPRRVFCKNLLENYCRLIHYYSCLPLSVKRGSISCRVIQGDNRYCDMQDRAHLVITSPPYGDGNTTVAYEQFSKLSLRWLGVEPQGRAAKRDQARYDPRTLSRRLDDSLSAIDKKDHSRAREVEVFFANLATSLEKIFGCVGESGRVCIVAGPRYVKGLELDTPQVIVEFARAFGFRPVRRIARKIPSKTLPRRNRHGTTINSETILIFSTRALPFKVGV